MRIKYLLAMAWISSIPKLLAQQNTELFVDNFPNAIDTVKIIESGSAVSKAPRSNDSLFTVVAEQTPGVIVQEQLDAYNARDIEAFLATYSHNIKVFNYPNELSLEGKENLKTRYKRFFKSTPELHCEIEERIIIGNKVIDKEKITTNARTFYAVAIYEVVNGKIDKVTFVK